MSNDCIVTPRTQKRREICQRRVDYFSKNGSALSASNGFSQSDTTRSSLATPKTAQSMAKPSFTASAMPIRAAGITEADGDKKEIVVSDSEEGECDTVPDVVEASESEASDLSDRGFRTHRPHEMEAAAAAGFAYVSGLAGDAIETSRSTELLIETQRDHLRDIIVQSRRSLDNINRGSSTPGSSQRDRQRQEGPSQNTESLLRSLEERHQARQSRHYPDYDAIIRELDSELSSHHEPKHQDADPAAAAPAAAAEATEYHRHFDAVKRHHEELQRRTVDEWAEQKLRESNSRATLERYFESLRRLSPRSGAVAADVPAAAVDIARQFEPVPEDVAMTMIVRCPDCGDRSQAAADHSWCYNCGCCLVGCKPEPGCLDEDDYREGNFSGDDVTSMTASSVSSLQLSSASSRRQHQQQQQLDRSVSSGRGRLPPELVKELHLDLPFE